MVGMLASFVGGETPLVLIWFGLFFVGLLFIARALRDDGRSREKDDSITDLDRVRNLPLRHVKEAIRHGPPTAHADTEGSARAKASKPRSIHGRTRGPIGLVK